MKSELTFKSQVNITSCAVVCESSSVERL